MINNIELDKNNIDFNNAVELVRHTNKLVYLTGKAGTGKTTFLKHTRDTTEKNTVIVAPTGVAAINAGGVTIHSFFQLPFGPIMPNDSRLRTNASGDGNKDTLYAAFPYSQEKREIIRNLELLIIDEVSMVRADTLDVIDKILKVFRKKPYLPFGGVQVILIGDTFQLPPIVDNQYASILSQFYKTPFFFSSKVIKENKPIYIELKKIYRQNEQEFIDLLNRVRVNELSKKDFDILNAKFNPSFSGNNDDYIILATHNAVVNTTNLQKLKELNTKLFVYEANVTGIFPDKHKPTDHNLNLKVGAQVMFVKNDSGDQKRYFNGKIGKIKHLGEKSITVLFDDETEVEVGQEKWDNIKYTYDKDRKRFMEEVIGTFVQFPIRLAWAITVHKSQGLTFEKVIADLGKAFAPGQVYVALSRCTSFSGLQLKTRIYPNAIKTDSWVLEFAKNVTPETLVTEQLNIGRADFYYKKAREEFGKEDVKQAFDFFKRALKFRNDIDTKEFERYVVVKGNRLLAYREKFNDVFKKSWELKKGISKVERKIDESIQMDTEDVQKQDSEIKSLTMKVDRLLSHYKELENEIQLQKAEIKRLKNLKWYDKLVGKR